MVLGGAMPVGSSHERLDPYALPVCFTANDAGADLRQRQVELDRERVVLHRSVRGIRMAVRLPMSAFLGIALRLEPAGAGAEAGTSDLISVSLEHRDPALTVPLYSAHDNDDVVAEWQLWARILGRPLLIADLDGTLRQPFRQMGTLRVGKVAPRRRRRNAIKRRRPSILLRRRPGRMSEAPLIRRGEREIIARS
jgi:Family of unknown function (DUF6101)